MRHVPMDRLDAEHDGTHRFPFGLLFAGRGGRGPRGPGRPGSGGFGPPGFGPGGFGGAFFRFGQRARRGDVRAAILSLLNEAPRNGYQIMQEIKQRSGGVWAPSPGAVYPALQQLQDEKLIAEEESSSGRAFELTELGRTYIQSHPKEVAAPWEVLADAAGDDFFEVMALARQLGGAALQVMQAGDAKQIEKAKKLLSATRRSLYQILAETEDEE